MFACLLVLVITGPLKICVDKDPFKIGLMKEQRIFTPYKPFSPKKKEHIPTFLFSPVDQSSSSPGEGNERRQKGQECTVNVWPSAGKEVAGVG